MKQKIKSKFTSVKNKKSNQSSSTKCLKMSESSENLTVNGLNQPQLSNRSRLNIGDQKQSNKFLASCDNQSNNFLSSANKSSLVGGRLQFYKDGKFILELARAKEGEKTGWISVPRKTFWPPTISTHGSTCFNKHESSATLSFSDDNSSVQSSPWQRDHCWKQAKPRQNISKEMTLYYYRPSKIRLTKECLQEMQKKRRRPLDKTITAKYEATLSNKDFVTKTDTENNISKTKIKTENTDVDELDCGLNLVKNCNKQVEHGTKQQIKQESSDDNKSNDSDDNNKNNNNNLTDEKLQQQDSNNSDKSQKLIVNNNNINNNNINSSKKPGTKKLDCILKRLSDRLESNLVLTNTQGINNNHNLTNSNNNNNHSNSNSSNITNYSIPNHMSNIHQHQHQLVSPRKRILRDFEKVSLDDQIMKRSRPKSTHSMSSMNNSNIVNTKLASPIQSIQKMESQQSPQQQHASSKDLNDINCDNKAHIKVKNESPTTTIASSKPSTASRPFSSYTITSLLGHNSINGNNNNNGKTSNINENNFNKTLDQNSSNNSNSRLYNDNVNGNTANSPSTSHFHQMFDKAMGDSLKSPLASNHTSSSSSVSLLKSSNHQQNQHSSHNSGNNKRKSPTTSNTPPSGSSFPAMLSDYNMSTTPSSGSFAMRSPDLSPSPEHHAFQKYRPQRITPTPPTSSPYDYQYSSASLTSSPGYLRKTPSPNDSFNHHHPHHRLRTNSAASNYNVNSQSTHPNKDYIHLIQNHSPSSNYSKRSSPSNYCEPSQKHSPNYAMDRESPNVTLNEKPSSVTSTTVRTVPKKTAALRQQYCSPSPVKNDPPLNRAKESPNHEKMSKRELSYDIDALSPIRPSVLIAPPPPVPIPSPGIYYMYPSFMQSPSYYNHLYNPAALAAAAAFGNPMYMQFPGSPSMSPGHHPSSAPSSSNNRTAHSNYSSHLSNQNSHIPANPWNPIPLTTHSINDGNLINKIKDEPSSDVPLNLSKH